MRISGVTTVLVAALCSCVARADQYAVLIAGSNSWFNYRHQADIAHAYKSLTASGVPADNIITFMYDDIAKNFENPHPGKLFNHPDTSSKQATDVYDAIDGNIDYTGKDVNSDNFLAVLQGQSTNGGTGRTLKSGKDDHVFVYFADHGGRGVLGMPTGQKLLEADNLNAALTAASEAGMFKQLVFYVEACESGSIFDGLLKAKNVYVVTAANDSESSWGWYCGGLGSQTGSNTVMGKSLGVCLGDEFSVRFMENTDADTKLDETLKKQFSAVKSAVTKSHPQQFGTLTFLSEPIADFMGEKARNASNVYVPEPQSAVGVDSRDAAVRYLQWKVRTASTDIQRAAAQSALTAELQSRDRADAVFKRVWMRVTGEKDASGMFEYRAPRNFDCMRDVHDAVYALGGYSDYSLKYIATVSLMCELGHSSDKIAGEITLAATTIEI